MNTTERLIPKRLHISTYDIRGVRLDTGEPKPTRQTGLVTQTHQLIGGFVDGQPNLRLSVTQSTSPDTSRYKIRIPEGPEAWVFGIANSFPEYLHDPQTGRKDKELVKKYYEDEIHDPQNPVYDAMGRQYADHIYASHSPNVLLQNANPIVSLLKAEELGYLDPVTAGQLNVVGVVHDIEGYRQRLQYAVDRMGNTNMNFKIIAISEFLRQQLLEMGMPEDRLFKVPNGFDIEGFDASVEQVKEANVFATVKERNNLPDGDMVFMSARRVPHKRHFDLIDAAAELNEQGKLDGKYFAFTGADMYTIQHVDHEEQIQKRIREKGLERKVFLLDRLTTAEVHSCWANAYASVLPSDEPEGFGYANIESMLVGAPVITTSLGGPLDYIIDGETGLFVEPHSPSAIAFALERLFTDQVLYQKIKRQARNKAEEYSVANMISGYEEAFVAGRPQLNVTIFPGHPFIKIGEGMHTEVFIRLDSQGKADHVVQTFRKDVHDLTYESVQQDYAYLLAAFADMPNLIPHQTFVHQEDVTELRDTVLFKERVIEDSQNGNLRSISKDDLQPKTQTQIEQFIAITKSLFSHNSEDPAMRELGRSVPDIIDPEFENVVIDVDGNLKLVDTNRLISVQRISEKAAHGAKVDIDRKYIHALLFRRLLYFEAKFLGKTPEQLKHDPFYTHFLDESAIEALMERSSAVGEPIVYNAPNI